jgi:hypothetical protein
MKIISDFVQVETGIENIFAVALTPLSQDFNNFTFAASEKPKHRLLKNSVYVFILRHRTSINRESQITDHRHHIVNLNFPSFNKFYMYLNVPCKI